MDKPHLSTVELALQRCHSSERERMREVRTTAAPNSTQGHLSRTNVSLVRFRTSLVRHHRYAGAGDSMNDNTPVPAVAEEHRNSAEAARNDAEQFRRLAEETREVRDHHREALEAIRQEREHLRNVAETVRTAGEQTRIAAETARTAGEEARDAAHAAREAVVETVRATAEALSASLEQMQLVEDMRRTLREVRDRTKLDSN